MTKESTGCVAGALEWGSEHGMLIRENQETWGLGSRVQGCEHGMLIREKEETTTTTGGSTVIIIIIIKGHLLRRACLQRQYCTID